MHEGQRINLTFLHFHIQDDSKCDHDYLEVDHSSRHCGHIQKAWSIISSGNTMSLRFISDGEYTFTGFEAVWTATTAPPSFNFKRGFGFGCENCVFPFVLKSRRYHSCANVDGDHQTYCLNGIIPPSVDGTHISLAPPIKVPCSDSDSSCHRIPQMSTHLNNVPGYCCKFCTNNMET